MLAYAAARARPRAVGCEKASFSTGISKPVTMFRLGVVQGWAGQECCVDGGWCEVWCVVWGWMTLGLDDVGLVDMVCGVVQCGVVWHGMT